MFLSNGRTLAQCCARRGLASPTSIFSRASNLAPRAAISHTNTSLHFSTDSKSSRPLSPNVFIFKWPINAISSISMRITGGLLTVGLYGIAFQSLVGGDPAAMMSCLGSSAVGPLVKFSVAFPLSYHCLVSCRHFYWEKNPGGLNVESQAQSSMAFFAVAGAIGAISMVV
mmetsp:Transcript_14760/g.24005  ORF Transcript_14760/g.24005 Transcript_14760/m.24005 type:complete len:170 (+) Transcript_14760:79-588(+)